MVKSDIYFLSLIADFPDKGRFSWSRYLEDTGSKAVAADAFKVVRHYQMYILLYYVCLFYFITRL